MAPPTRVLLVDDYAIVRHGLRAILASENGITVVGEAEDGHEAVQATATLRPDVVILDLVMPHCDGLTATVRIRAAYPSVHIIGYTAFLEPGRIAAVIGAGASGYVCKMGDSADIVRGIRAVATGGIYVSSCVVETVCTTLAETGLPLNSSEQMLLTLAAQSYSDAAIAQALAIPVDAVAGRLRALRARLGNSENRHAAAVATELLAYRAVTLPQYSEEVR